MKSALDNEISPGFNRTFMTLFCSSLLCLFSMQSCQEKSGSPLAADPDIQAIFTDTEIEDLETILDFFEGEICELSQVRRDSILDCYDEFFKNVSTAQSTGIIYIPVPFHEQLEMYKSLSPSTLQEVWLVGTAVNQTTGDTTERFSLNVDGKYAEFLKALRRDYQILEAYQRSFLQERKMATPMIETLLYNFHLLNMKDIRIRLFVALHYLTLNDLYERKNNAG